MQDFSGKKNMNKLNRRSFLKNNVAGISIGFSVPYWFTATKANALQPACKNDRIKFALVGCGGMGRGDAGEARKFGDIVAVCDVDARRARKASTDLSDGQAAIYEDYRKLLDKEQCDVVICATPDHWHTRVVVDAIVAGKDVYCEKPLTLTIEEGQILRDVVRNSDRIVQVGTQQRSKTDLFLKAIALVQQGRLGEIKKAQCAIGGAPASGPIPVAEPPKELNWDMWLGQAPAVDFRATGDDKGGLGKTRCHYEFRWWYEYSGGKMTDWGAHHVDIGTWALGMTGESDGPVSIEGTAKHPVDFKDGDPVLDDQYNTAEHFNISCKYKNGTELVIRHDTDNGVLIEGTEGRIFVNRGKLVGKPVEDLKENPLPEDALKKAYKGVEPYTDGSSPANHWRHFVDCLKERREPISDIFSHLQALDTCHLANIAIRLNRKIEWDPVNRRIVGDDQAQAMTSRRQRSGYEIEVPQKTG
jgi:predicted dehydrogenase